MTGHKRTILLDTNIIIEAVRTGCWDGLRGHYELVTVEKCREEARSGIGRTPGYVMIEDHHLNKNITIVRATELECARLATACPDAHVSSATWCGRATTVLGLTRNLVVEIGPHGIRVNLVAGGLLHVTDASRVTTEEVFQIVAQSSPLRRVVTGGGVRPGGSFLHLGLERPGHRAIDRLRRRPHDGLAPQGPGHRKELS